MIGINQNKKNVYRLADESVPESLTKFVIGYLTKEIIEGRLEPGHRLIPEELASRLKVSKSPIREALVALEKEGLVENVPRIGFYVTEIKLEDIEEIYPIRASLNALAVRLIVQTGYKPDMITTLRKMLQDMKKQAEKGDVDKYFRLNVQFYDFLLGCCPSERLKRMISQLGKQVLMFRHLSMSKPGHIDHSLTRHKELVKAMEEKDVEASHRIAERVIYDALEVIRQLIEKKRAE
jgi:DNA-binding GntR family transcriptional regulator